MDVKKQMEELLRSDAALLKQAAQAGILQPAIKQQAAQALDAFKTNDARCLKCKDMARVLSKRNECVLIFGESGTGKELVASILHGDRCGNFHGENVCAVSDTLFESELFGHVRGAFTGANTNRDGLIQTCAEGTLFLDEIGDMAYSLQGKLLRTIQTKEYRKVGGDVRLPVMCRFVFATHRNMQELVRTNCFRLDLYERISTFVIRIPPLRERPLDAELYVTSEFWNAAKEKITHSHLSGNIRQLQNLDSRFQVFGMDYFTDEDWQ